MWFPRAWVAVIRRVSLVLSWWHNYIAFVHDSTLVILDESTLMSCRVVAHTQVLRVLWFCMSYGNSCANPIIYNYASTDFRAGFRRAVFRLLVCLPKQQPDRALSPASTRYQVVAGTNIVRLSPRQPTAMSTNRIWNVERFRQHLVYTDVPFCRCYLVCLMSSIIDIGGRCWAWSYKPIIFLEGLPVYGIRKRLPNFSRFCKLTHQEEKKEKTDFRLCVVCTLLCCVGEIKYWLTAITQITQLRSNGCSLS